MTNLHDRARRSDARRKRPSRRVGLGLLVAAAMAVFVALLAPAAGAQTEDIFTDGFESGDVATGGWATTGAVAVDGNANSGGSAALVDDTGSLTKVVSTVGYVEIGLQYARYTYGYDLGEELTVEWSTNGATWTEVETYSSSGWATNQAQLGAAAAGQAALRIRFSSNADGFLERFRIDDVVISGTRDGGPTLPTTTTAPPSTNCLPPVDDYDDNGPFSHSTDDVGRVNIWVPEGLPAGCKVPIIHLANGTGARCSTYGSALRFFASHGFVAACYEDTDTGQGSQAIDAIEAVIDEYPDLVDTRYGFTGHSQGGGGAILGVYRAEQEWGDSRTYAGLGMQPAHGFGDSPLNYASLYGQIESPIAMFNGSTDFLVSASWVRRGYNDLDDDLEKAWYEAVGAPHIPVPNDEGSEMGLAWFRWQLLGDSDACEYFKAMPSSSGWRLQETDNLSAC